jgi:hypothetical protein
MSDDLRHFLAKQFYDFRHTHTAKETTWMLDCKVLGAAQVYAEAWEKDPQKTVEMIKKFSSPALIIEEAYHILVNRKAIKPVKEMSKDFQTELIDTVKEIFGEAEEKIFYRYAKAIYLFSQLPVEIKKDW